jgi:adenylosuccinate synthase
MMKADVLNSFNTIKICTHYRLKNGEVTEHFPYDLLDDEVEPVYKEFKGWKTSLQNMSSFEQLPSELTEYIAFIEDSLNLPITLLSVSPDRTATLQREGVLR